MGKVNRWTENENQTIMANLEKSIDELEHLIPSRTRRQIRDKLKRLGRKYRFETIAKRANDSLNISETDKAYIAGLIDGEGTIGISKNKENERRRYSFEPYVSVANTNKELLKFLKEKVGRGNVYSDNYLCRYYDVKPLLEAVKPYLIIKRKQAALVLEFINLRMSREKWWSPPTTRELEIYEELRELNKKPKLSKRIPTREEVMEYFRRHPLEVLVQ